MVRSIFAVGLVSLSLSGLVGCSDDSDSDEPKAPGKSAESTEPKGGKSSSGPECTKYFECCEEVAKAQPALAGSCDSTKKSVDDAISKGASTDSYESACKQALSAMQSGGYCK